MSARTRRIVVTLIVGSLVLLPLIALGAQTLVSVGISSERPLAILLLGSDAGQPRDDDPLTGRADGFQILLVSADRQHASFVSVPRDSWVPVPGLGDTKINACLTRGADVCAETVENTFGIEIDGWFVTSMWGFADAVNEFVGCPIGDPELSRECTRGLTVDVDYTCTASCGGFVIPQRGVQDLSGFEALTHARFRKSRTGGDFGRAQGQAELLAAAHASLQTDGSLAKMMDSLRVLMRHSATDLTMPQVVRLGLDAMRLDPANVDRVLLPSRIGTVGAASVVFINDEAFDLVAEAAATGRLPASR